jgi:DNA-binding NarL/FixJ family response regulator
MREEWPLVGRTVEWEAAVRAVLVDQGGLVVAGRPGVGKTRFASDLADHARALGYSVEAVVATRSASSIPFGLLAHLAGQRSDLPSRTEMLTRLQEAFAARAAAGSLLVVVDDAHLVDGGTAAVLHAVASARRVRLLLTIRSGASPPDAVTGLWKDGQLARIDLGELPPAQMERLVAEILGGPVDIFTKHRLLELCGGNPLFLRETIHAGTVSGALRSVDGIWRWDGRPLVAERLEEVIGERLAEIGADDNVAIQALALAEPLPVEVLVRLIGSPAVESLERSGVVVSAPGAKGRLEARLTHPIYGEVIRARLAKSAEARLLAELADLTVELPGVSVDDRLRAAVWRADSGAPLDMTLTLSSARRALALCDFRLSLRLAARALEEGGGTEARLVAAHSLYWTDQFEQCDVLLRELEEPATEQQRMEATIVRSSALFWGLDQVDAAKGLIEDQLSRLRGPAERLVLRGHLAALTQWSGDPPAARRLYEQVLSEPAVSSEARLRAAVPAALGAAIDGRHDEAVDLAVATLPDAIDHLQSLPLAAGEIMVVQAAAEWMCGDLATSRDLIRGLIEWSLEHGVVDLVGILTLLSGQVSMARGDIAAAVADFREAVAVLRQHDPGRVLAWAWAALASALGQSGDGAGSAAAAVQAASAARSASGLFAPMVSLGGAWSNAAQGATSLAAERLVEVADGLRGRQMKAVELIVLTDLARLGEPAEARSRLAVLAGDLPSSSVRAAFDLAAGLADADPEALERASASFERRGALLLAAEAALHSVRLRRLNGQLGAASAGAERARALLLVCLGARTPLVVSGKEELVDPLSPREREIATLASNGLPNRAIAERLGLSARTIENHLARAFVKLGVNDRGQLRKVLGQQVGQPMPPPPGTRRSGSGAGPSSAG